jgi:hypothetical protein
MQLILKGVDLAAGWLDAALFDGSVYLSLRAADWSDAPADLARATIRLLAGDERSTCAWAYEPGLYHWRFQSDGTRLQIEILDDPEGLHDRTKRTKWIPRGVFNCALREWANEVVGFLELLSERYQEREYKRAWGHEFPWNEMTRLCELVSDAEAKNQEHLQHTDFGR